MEGKRLCCLVIIALFVSFFVILASFMEEVSPENMISVRLETGKEATNVSPHLKEATNVSPHPMLNFTSNVIPPSPGEESLTEAGVYMANLNTRALGKDERLDFVTKAILKHWRKIWMNTNVERKYIIYKGGTRGYGWGNQARGLTSAFSFMISFEYLPVIDYDAFWSMFKDRRDEIQIPYAINDPTFKEFLELFHSASEIPIAIMDEDNDKLYNILLAKKKEHKVLRWECGCTFESKILSIVREKLNIPDLTMREFDGAILRFLMGKPTAPLLNHAGEVLMQHGFVDMHKTDFKSIFVQFRGFMDDPGARAKLDLDFQRDCIVDFVNKTAQGYSREDVKLFITSDDAGMMKQLKSIYLEPFSNHIEWNRLKVHFTGSDTAGLVANAGMVDWFMAATFDSVACAGSTFCISALGRVGFSDQTELRTCMRKGRKSIFRPDNSVYWRL